MDKSCALAFLTAAAFLLLTPQRLSRAGVTLADQPAETAAFLRSRPDLARLRLYNPWGWGGYLGWSVGGPYRVFYDGRYLFHDLLAPSMEAAKDGPAWNRFLDEQKLDGAVLDRRSRPVRLTYREPGGAIRERVVPETVALMPPERWTLVHADSVALVYLRK